MASHMGAGRTRSSIPRWSAVLFADAMTKAEALLFARRTWQTIAAAWPERAGDPFANEISSLPKYVVPDTLGDDELTWDNTTRVSGDKAIARIRVLHDTDGGDLLIMEPDARADPPGWKPARSTPAHDRAGHPRRRQDDIPRRRCTAHARACLHGHQRHGCAPTGRLPRSRSSRQRGHTRLAMMG